MPAPVVLVVVDEVGVRLLGPAPRGPVDLVGEDAHADRDGHALDVEKRGSLFSQYSRAEDTPVFVSQNSVMLSRMSSRVRSLGLSRRSSRTCWTIAGLADPVAVIEHERREGDR